MVRWEKQDKLLQDLIPRFHASHILCMKSKSAREALQEKHLAACEIFEKQKKKMSSYRSNVSAITVCFKIVEVKGRLSNDCL